MVGKVAGLVHGVISHASHHGIGKGSGWRELFELGVNAFALDVEPVAHVSVVVILAGL